MSNTETNGNTIFITARKGHIQALAFANKGGEALSNLLSSVAEAKQLERMGPLQTFLFLETHFTDEEGHAIPVVGSKIGETGNLPYDKYTTEVKTENGTRKVPGSWFTDVVNSTSKAISIRERIEHLKQAQGEGVPPDVIKMNTGERAVEVKRLRQFLADMRTALTRGAMLFHQVEAVAKMNPERVTIKMPFFKQKNDKGEEVMVVKGSLIRLIDPSGQTEEDEVVTVSQFLAFDTEKAGQAEDKGSIESLKATAARAPRNTGKAAANAQGTDYKVPVTVEQTLTLFNVLASAVDQEDDAGEKRYAQLLAKVSSKDKDADETVLSIGKVCLALDSLWTIVRPRYLALHEKMAKAANNGTTAAA